MAVEQEFNSNLVPEIHKVRHATSEFKDFAKIWWRELSNLHLQPEAWDRLKEAMRVHFIPPSYKRDWRRKLQHLEQGNMSIQEYYAEFGKCIIRCGIVEAMEDKIVCFYGGLRHEIQDIVYHKKICTVNRLFQLAMLAENELQGCQQKNQTNIGDNLNHILARVEQAFVKVETVIRR